MFRILQLLLLLLTTLSLAQEDYEDVDLLKCFAALKDADADGNNKIDADEHLAFLQQFGPSDYWVQLTERPLELKAKFNTVACMCMQRGGVASCCNGDNAGIDISGIDDDQDSAQRDYLETVCILTQRAIDAVEMQRFENGRQQGDAISVWLRTAYQVVLVQGNTQTEAEVLIDLAEAMNTLVEEVLQEELVDARRYLRQRRHLQEVEYLPTRLEWTPTGML